MSRGTFNIDDILNRGFPLPQGTSNNNNNSNNAGRDENGNCYWDGTSQDAVALRQLIASPDFRPTERPKALFQRYPQFHKYGLPRFRQALRTMKKKQDKQSSSPGVASIPRTPMNDVPCDSDDDDDEYDGKLGNTKALSCTPNQPVPNVRSGNNGGVTWYPFHFTAEFPEERTHRSHFIIVVLLPSGVATDNHRCVRVYLTNNGTVLEIQADWPGIMVEDGLKELHNCWKKEDRGTSFERMKNSLDKAIVALKDKLQSNSIAGIFRVSLPFVAAPPPKKIWIMNKKGCRLLYAILAKATLEVNDDGEEDSYAEADATSSS